ncbi:MAG: S9 family peptidase [Steroidobacteraceae bacterium]
MSLSPDGTSIAFIAPERGQGGALFTLRLDNPDATPKLVVAASGDPERLSHCSWVGNQRLACSIFLTIEGTIGRLGLVAASRVLAVNADGSNLQSLSITNNEYTRGLALGGGEIIDLLPDLDGSILMSRRHLPDKHTGSLIGSDEKGLGVDRVDTQTGNSQVLEPPRPRAKSYLTDGLGHVRIVGDRAPSSPSLSRVDSDALTVFFYRQPGSTDWQKLSEYDWRDRSGFLPLGVDPAKNVVYGAQKLDGRQAIYSIALDGTLKEELVFARPDVDVSALVQVGRHHRVVGVSYVTDVPHIYYFETGLANLATSIAKSLSSGVEARIIDSSTNERRLLLFVSRDNEPGTYYLFDRDTHQLRPLTTVRGALDNVKLAEVRPVSYPASDGTLVPGYLTLPPGTEHAQGLAAIVMPHGGPGSRDVWGFNWLAQFFAARGYAVLQPNYRGSTGYGDGWFEQNAWHSWALAIGDVLDGGRWLVAQGIADPRKLGIVGWSYGGYAALQSAVVDSSVFKAVVAIAPVTDLDDLAGEWGTSGGLWAMRDYVGSGAEAKAASPAEHADSIKVPVLLFHGTYDRNVSVQESEHMARNLKAASVPYELVIFEKLDHQLDDSAVRAKMLAKSDAFLRQAFGP